MLTQSPETSLQLPIHYKSGGEADTASPGKATKSRGRGRFKGSSRVVSQQKRSAKKTYAPGKRIGTYEAKRLAKAAKAKKSKKGKATSAKPKSTKKKSAKKKTASRKKTTTSKRKKK